MLPNARHRLIARMPFAAIVTTNYDELIERAYHLEHQRPARTCTADSADSIIRALVHGEFFILKAHGDIKDRKTIVLSERDYREVMHRKPGYIAALQNIFLTKTVLFVGTSITDQDIIRVLEALKESFGEYSPQQHFALVPKDRAGELERQFWKRFYNIEFLTYEDHTQVDLFLEALHEAVKRIISPASREERVPEAKWYPEKTSLNNIRGEMESRVPRLLGCGLPNKDMLEEVNILFDTPKGTLFKSRVNLSIKVIALRRNDKIEKLEARWLIIKLLNYGANPDKFWDTERSGDVSPKVFPYSGDIRKDISNIVWRLHMSSGIRSMLKARSLTRASVKPAVVIAVKREQWDFGPGLKWKAGLRLFISHVNIHPYSRKWIEKLPGKFEALLSKKIRDGCAWDELEIEEHGNGGENIREFSSQFSELEKAYRLNTASKHSRPVAKYHNAVKVLRRLRNTQRTHTRDQTLFDGWLPFLYED